MEYFTKQNNNKLVEADESADESVYESADESPIKSADESPIKSTDEPLDKIDMISIPFGTIIYRDNKYLNESYHVSITDISLFCNMVKVWTGAKNGKKIKDKNGNCKWCPDNRIEDTERSKVIAESIKNNKFLPITYLQISQIKNNDKYLYKLWDGQHRKSAIKLLLNEEKYHDIIKSKFKCIIYLNDNETSIKHKFVTINKSVPVSPALIKKIIQQLQDITPNDKKKMNYINNIANNVGIKLSITYK